MMSCSNEIADVAEVVPILTALMGILVSLGGSGFVDWVPGIFRWDPDLAEFPDFIAGGSIFVENFATCCPVRPTLQSFGLA